MVIIFYNNKNVNESKYNEDNEEEKEAQMVISPRNLRSRFKSRTQIKLNLLKKVTTKLENQNFNRIHSLLPSLGGNPIAEFSPERKRNSVSHSDNEREINEIGILPRLTHNKPKPPEGGNPPESVDLENFQRNLQLQRQLIREIADVSLFDHSFDIGRNFKRYFPHNNLASVLVKMRGGFGDLFDPKLLMSTRNVTDSKKRESTIMGNASNNIRKRQSKLSRLHSSK